MKSGEERISFMLTRSEIEAIVSAFEGYAAEWGYFHDQTKEFIEKKMDPVAGQVYERMIASLNILDMLDMMDEEDPDGN